MAVGDFEATYTRNRGWHVTVQGSYDTQDEAWAAARYYARRMGREGFLRGLSGRWRKRETYPKARDPRESRG